MERIAHPAVAAPPPVPAVAECADEVLLARYVDDRLRVYFTAKFPAWDRESLDRRLCELLKFLILVRDFPGNILFGEEIDNVWHAWILQTREYAAMCALLPGGAFRHHSSRAYPEEVVAGRAPGGFEANAQRILSFFASYRASFGPVRAENIPLWPPLERLVTRLGWDAAALDSFLLEQIARARPPAAGMAS